MFGMLSVLAEFQRELIVANTRDGLAAARARGRKGGRPSKLSSDQIELAQRLCPTCGHEPTSRAEAAHQRADLAVIWLHPDPEHRGTLIGRQHCRHCEPEQPAFDIACSVWTPKVAGKPTRYPRMKIHTPAISGKIR